MVVSGSTWTVPASTAPTTSTTVTTTMSYGTVVSSAATTVTTASTASHALASSASPSVGSTLQTLLTTITAMSARMDAMETAIHTQAAAPKAVAPKELAPTPPQVCQPNIPPITATAPLAPLQNLAVPQQPTTIPPPPPQYGTSGQTATAPVPLRSAVSGRVQQELMAALGDSSSSDSDDNYHQATRSKSRRLKSGRSRTSEDVVKRHVDWPHFNVFKGPSRAAAEFDSLTIPEFVYGYMGNVLKPGTPTSVQLSMLRHLRELMHDATMFPWEGVRNFHGILLRLMEHDEATWNDRALIQELRAQYSRTPAASNKSYAAVPSHPRPRSRPCPDFQKGVCTHSDDHESHQGKRVSHICGWCYRVRRKSFQHPEKDCFTKRKRESKNEETESDV